MTLRVGSSLRVVVLALVLGGAPALWAEDQPMQDWTGGQVSGTPYEPPSFEPVPLTPAQQEQEALDKIDPLRLREKHGIDKVYVDEHGQAFTYGSQDGRVLTAEEAAAEAERLGIEHKEVTRKWVNEAIGAERAGQTGDLNINVHDNVRVNEVGNGTLESQRRLEKMIDDDVQKVKEETKRVVPLRTLISDEAGRREVQVDSQTK